MGEYLRSQTERFSGWIVETNDVLAVECVWT